MSVPAAEPAAVPAPTAAAADERDEVEEFKWLHSLVPDHIPDCHNERLSIAQILRSHQVDETRLELLNEDDLQLMGLSEKMYLRQGLRSLTAAVPKRVERRQVISAHWHDFDM